MSGVKIYAPVLYCENYIYKVDMIECEDMGYVKQSDYDSAQKKIEAQVMAIEKLIEQRNGYIKDPDMGYGIDHAEVVIKEDDAEISAILNTQEGK